MPSAWLEAEIERTEQARRLQDELVSQLVAAPDAFLERVATTQALQTDAVANMLVAYAERFVESLGNTRNAVLAEACLIAARDSRDLDLLVRVWKWKGNIRSMSGHFSDTHVALREASRYAKRLNMRLHRTCVRYARAAVLFRRRRTARAATELSAVLAEFVAMGEVARAAHVRRFLAYLDYRENNIEATLARAEQDAAEAIRAGAEESLAALYHLMAACYTTQARYGDALAVIAKALDICTQYGMDVRRVHVEVSRAELLMLSVGIAEGMAALRVAHAQYMALGMPWDAVQALFTGLETLATVDEHADEVVTLCRQIQAEATRLDLSVEVADVAHRLRIAAEYGYITEEFVKACHAEFNAVARASDAAN